MADTRKKSSLDRFEQESFSFEGATRDIYRRGAGPAVIVIAEMPGITPLVLGFAERVADLGLTAVLPHLFGTPGKETTGTLATAGYVMKSLTMACVSKEFSVWAAGKSSPVVSWLRGLAASEHARCGGPGVGAVGMCFTGGFALAMATNPSVVAPALAQPSLPFPTTRKNRAGIDTSAADLAIVAGRCASEGMKVVGVRFEGDPLSPASRFSYLSSVLGDAFVGVQLPDNTQNPLSASPKPHGTLTEDLDESNASVEGLNTILEHFRSRLLG